MKGKGTKIQANFLPTSSSTNRRTDKNSIDSLKMAVIKYITFSVPPFYQNTCYLWRRGCSSYKIRAGCSIIILHTPSQTQLYSYIKDSSHKHKRFLVDAMEFVHLCQVLPHSQGIRLNHVLHRKMRLGCLWRNLVHDSNSVDTR